MNHSMRWHYLAFPGDSVKQGGIAWARAQEARHTPDASGRSDAAAATTHCAAAASALLHGRRTLVAQIQQVRRESARTPRTQISRGFSASGSWGLEVSVFIFRVRPAVIIILVKHGRVIFSPLSSWPLGLQILVGLEMKMQETSTVGIILFGLQLSVLSIEHKVSVHFIDIKFWKYFFLRMWNLLFC